VPAIAAKLDAQGAFDAVMHNAGVGYRGATPDSDRGRAASGVRDEHAGAPSRTALIRKPKRLVYLGVGMRRDAIPLAHAGVLYRKFAA
jgi:hypothetical protein